jgi:hypothetical protein
VRIRHAQRAQREVFQGRSAAEGVLLRRGIEAAGQPADLQLLDAAQLRGQSDSARHEARDHLRYVKRRSSLRQRQAAVAFFQIQLSRKLRPADRKRAGQRRRRLQLSFTASDRQLRRQLAQRKPLTKGQRPHIRRSRRERKRLLSRLGRELQGCKRKRQRIGGNRQLVRD